MQQCLELCQYKAMLPLLSEKPYLSKVNDNVGFNDMKELGPYEQFVKTTNFTEPNIIIGFDSSIIDDSYASDRHVDREQIKICRPSSPLIRIRVLGEGVLSSNTSPLLHFSLYP